MKGGLLLYAARKVVICCSSFNRLSVNLRMPSANFSVDIVSSSYSIGTIFFQMNRHNVEATLMRIRFLSMPAAWYSLMSVCAFSMVRSVSKERRTSTSVETLPGTIFKICSPKLTANLSKATVICSFG